MKTDSQKKLPNKNLKETYPGGNKGQDRNNRSTGYEKCHAL